MFVGTSYKGSSLFIKGTQEETLFSGHCDVLMWSLESNKSLWHERSQPENEANTQRTGGEKQEGSRERVPSHCPKLILKLSMCLISRYMSESYLDGLLLAAKGTLTEAETITYGDSER